MFILVCNACIINTVHLFGAGGGGLGGESWGGGGKRDGDAMVELSHKFCSKIISFSRRLAVSLFLRSFVFPLFCFVLFWFWFRFRFRFRFCFCFFFCFCFLFCLIIVVLIHLYGY